MGKNSTPQYNPPPAPKYPTADELYGSATKYAKENSPLAFGARETALADISKGNAYYEGFQPTSFEQALGNQYFKNVWPAQEESIKHGLSLSGLDSSPILASMLGKARGQTEFDIGSYLTQQGNQRAVESLNYRNIDPNTMISPYVTTGMNQGNKQVDADYDYQQQMAQVAYQQAVDKYNQQQALYKTLGQWVPGAGNIYSAIDGGGSGFTTSMGGTMDTVKTFAPFLPMLGGGGGGGLASAVNPGSGMPTNSAAYNTMASSPVNYSMATSQYNPNQYFSGFGGRGGAV